MNKKIPTPLAILIIFLAMAVIIGISLWLCPKEETENVACTMEVKLCPDGSYVSRTGPNCESAECSAINTEASTTATTLDFSSTTADETASWKTYESKDLGLTFKFPNISGETQYSYNEYPKRDYDPTGTIYGWTIKRTDTEYKPSWSYTFAGGSSVDAMIGRSGWPTDNYRWLIENNKYYIETMGGSKVEVQIEKVSKPNSGVEGIILTSEKNPNLFAGEGEDENIVINRKLAIVNFPPSYSKKPQIKSISFYFYDSITTDQIEKVIQSVTFSN